MITPHTPGPWTVSRRNNGMIPVHFQPPCVLARGGNMTIADGLGDGPEAEANGRLIACAPELLAALERLTGFCIAYNRGVVLPSGIMEACEEARAAIAKAKVGV